MAIFRNAVELNMRGAPDGVAFVQYLISREHLATNIGSHMAGYSGPDPSPGLVLGAW
jgi:hypothetical protein